MDAVAAAILGALAAGLLQTIVSIVDRRREKESTLVALTCEVNSICELIRLQRYLPAVTEILADSSSAEWEATTVVIDIRSNYFSVYDSLAHNLGKLDSVHTAKIVSFYSHCKSAIDSAYPDGVMVDNDDKELAIANLENLHHLLDRVLVLGDEIVQFPKSALRGLLEQK